EFVAAITWIAEVFTDKVQKERWLGVTQAFASLGGVLVTAVNFWIIAHARDLSSLGLPISLGAAAPASWRYLMLSGVIPAIPIALMLPFVPESKIWRERKRAGTLKRPSFAQLFSPHLRKVTLVTAGLSAKFKGQPFNIFETGGTTGMPKQRIGWNDYKTDYEEFSAKISDAHFPRSGAWLMVGPTGPRRLRLAIEHLANYRGSVCYFIDLDPRWVKKVIAEKKLDVAHSYMDHVVEQAVSILKHRKVTGLFTTPKLLEALGEKVNLYEAGVRGVFCGGTTM